MFYKYVKCQNVWSYQSNWIEIKFLIWLSISFKMTASDIRIPFYYYGLTLFPAWRSNYTYYKVWDDITYPLPNFNDGTVEVWE